nr:MAG TPA: hypothetical protein [Bacteriophage sp.]
MFYCCHFKAHSVLHLRFCASAECALKFTVSPVCHA